MKSEKVVSLAVALGAACAAAIVCSCGDWERVDDSSSWNDAYNARFEWVNFSGTYKNSNGWYVVTQFRRPDSTISGSGGSSSAPGVRNYVVATSTERTYRFGGTLSPLPVMPGTVSFHATIEIGDTETLSDRDNDGLLYSSIDNGNAGFVNYYTGAFSLEFGMAVLPGTNVTVTFISGVQQGSTNVVVTTPPSPGSSRPIYQFVIVQDASSLTLTDNYGNTYTGRISRILSTAGGTDVDIRPGEVVTVTATFTAEGNGVRISGALEGVYTAARQQVGVALPGQTQEEYRGRLENRLVRGVWVETSGRSGAIEANALEPASTSSF
jgi:hypothetical protein